MHGLAPLVHSSSRSLLHIAIAADLKPKPTLEPTVGKDLPLLLLHHQPHSVIHHWFRLKYMAPTCTQTFQLMLIEPDLCS